MIFLEFAVLGSYITSMGGYLASIGLSGHIGPFYAVGGFAALVTPALMGILADRKIPSQRLYGMMHLILGIVLLFFGVYCRNWLLTSSVWVSLAVYSLIPLLMIPTIPLAYSTTFAVLKQNGMDVDRLFPRIRVFGTVGFIFSMLAVDLAGVQHSYMQFVVGGCLALILSVWSLKIPDCPPERRERGNWWGNISILLKNRQLCVFFALSMCLGMLERVSEAYTNPFLSSLNLNHPNAILSISRVAEVLGILLIPMMMMKWGIKVTILVAIASWIVYYAGLGFGNGGSLLPLIITSMLAYGVAFSFFSISGSIFVENTVSRAERSTAQGFMTMMTNGVGSTVGAMAAQGLFNMFVPSGNGGWSGMWCSITLFTGIVLCCTAIFFKPGKAGNF